MITTRSDVESLLTELIDFATELPKGETFIRGEMMVTITGYSI